MYYQFQAMDYPFIDIIETLAEDKGQALKASFVDFKLNVYSNVVAGIPLAQIVRITGSASSITLSLLSSLIRVLSNRVCSKYASATSCIAASSSSALWARSRQ